MRQVIDINSITGGISNNQKEQLRSFHQTLLRWNSKINLISRPTVPESEVLHVCDGAVGSLIILKNSKANIFYDLGSGNGIPGVTFAIVAPEMKITCVDSDERKISFIKFVKLDLGLQNLEVVCDRVENLELEGSADFMARGFTSIDEVCKLMKGKISPGNSFYHFKADGWEKEVGPNCSTWDISLLESYELITKLKDSPRRHIIRGYPLLEE